MLDINYIRNNRQTVKQACINKQLDATVIDQLLKVDQQRRQLQKKVDDVRASINEHAQKIKIEVTKGKKPTLSDREEGRQLKSKLKEIGPQLKEIEEQFQTLMYQIPNVPAEDVPVAADETGNVVVRQVGQPKKFTFTPQPHEKIMEKLGWLDTKRAVKLAGFRAYFLKGKGLLLEQAILRYALHLLVDADFTPMEVPVMVNETAMWGTGYFPWGAEDHYKTQDGQYLTGTAEVALTAYHQGEILKESDLPIKMCGISPCFRREVGSYGKDTQGIVRVHQFNKIEQVVYTVADETVTREWHEKMLGLAEKLLKKLNLPYQVLAMCTGDMGAGQRKKYDLETWFPAQNKYRETHSASYFNDFQARRLNIRYQTKDGLIKYIYTLNNTMAATPRLLAAIVENYQTANGQVEIPTVLKRWM